MLVWPISTYSFESQTITKSDEQQTEVAGMRGLHQILMVLWPAKETTK